MFKIWIGFERAHVISPFQKLISCVACWTWILWLLLPIIFHVADRLKMSHLLAGKLNVLTSNTSYITEARQMHEKWEKMGWDQAINSIYIYFNGFIFIARFSLALYYPHHILCDYPVENSRRLNSHTENSHRTMRQCLYACNSKERPHE